MDEMKKILAEKLLESILKHEDKDRRVKALTEALGGFRYQLLENLARDARILAGMVRPGSADAAQALDTFADTLIAQAARIEAEYRPKPTPAADAKAN